MPGLGALTVDVAYGDMIYVLVEDADAGFSLVPEEAREICAAGQAWITGIGQVGLDPSDPYPQGCTLADTWLRAL